MDGASGQANHSVRFNQPIVFFSHTKLAQDTSYQPASSIFLSQQISTSHSNAIVVTVFQGKLMICKEGNQ